jgi:hypothetical protein
MFFFNDKERWQDKNVRSYKGWMKNLLKRGWEFNNKMMEK